MPAERAYQLGLVDERRACRQAARDRRRDRRTRSPPTRRAAGPLSKQACGAASRCGYTQALEYGWALLRLHWDHPDFKEGPRAFAEKREPRLEPDRTRATGTRREPDTRARGGGVPPRGGGVPRGRRDRSTASSSTRTSTTTASREAVPRAGRARLAVAGWPKAAGGPGLPPVYEYILWDEMAYARAARPPLASGIVAKTIIALRHRRAAQRWLPRLRAGETVLLARLLRARGRARISRRRAHPCGARRECYVLNGEKCWTSGAARADYLWVLCRTGTPGEPRQGAVAADRRPARAGHRASRRSRRSTGSASTRCASTTSIVPVAEARRRGGRRLDDHGRGAGRRAPRPVPPKRRAARLEELVALVRRTGSLTTIRSCARRLADLAVEVAEVEALALRVLDAMQRGRRGRRRGGVQQAGRQRMRASGSRAWRSTSAAPKRSCAARRRVPLAPVHVGDDRRRHLGGDARRRSLGSPSVVGAKRRERHASRPMASTLSSTVTPRPDSS